MDLGLTMFTTDLTMDPADLAREAESRGFTSLWVPEHTHIPTSRRTPAPSGEPLAEEYKRSLDPFVALAFAAAATTRLRLGTGVALPAQREPIVTAKAAATLDRLSGGRLTLGVGFGWNEDELEDHGVTKAERRDVARERVLAMQALWADEVAAFEGDHVRVPPSWAWPKPRQQVGGRTGVPVLVGGAAGPKLFDHVVEYAEGWLPIGGAGLSRDLPELRRRWEEAGRDPAALQVVPFGTLPDEGKLAHYAELGITEVVLRVPGGTRDEVLPVLDAHARFVA